MATIDSTRSKLETLRGFSALRLIVHFVLDPLGCLRRYADRLGSATLIRSPFPLGRFRRSILVLVGPEFNRQVLMAADGLRPTGIWPVRAPPGTAQHNLRRNYLVMHGNEHDRFADAVAPHLERHRVDAHFEEVKRIALAEVSHWPVGTVANVHLLLRKLAQHYAFALLFGEADLARIRRFGAMLAEYHEANWSLWAAILRVNLPGTPYRKVLRAAEVLQKFANEWARERKGCPRSNDVRSALVNMLVDESAGQTEDNIAAHLCGFALASYETTATTLSWALVFLASHPTVMAALVSEIRTAGPVSVIASEKLSELPLLDAVIKETMRLATPVPILGFRAVRDCTVAGFDLAQDTLVLISPQVTHQLSELYTEPNRFLPERWLSIRPTTYEYLPFSGGPRRCPGHLFAMNNLRMGLFVILSHYRVSMPVGGRIDRSYTGISSPRSGRHMRLDHQDNMDLLPTVSQASS